MFADHLLFSPERGLAANSDALKSIMVKFGSGASGTELGWPKLTQRNKISLFVLIFTGECILTHSCTRNESHTSKILPSCSTELHDQNFVKTAVLNFIYRSRKVARISILGKGRF